MSKHDRREFFKNVGRVAGVTSLTSVLPPSIQTALAIPANRRTGTIMDVEHVVILTQENRSFDHYFGTLPGVRGFADPFVPPAPDTEYIQGKSIWHQPSATPFQPVVGPFRLDTNERFDFMRVEGTPHDWTDAQAAWDQGRMSRWPFAKRNHSLAYFAESDLPFQWALANAFTLCDAYHCSAQTSTNPNRLFIWTGTNDPLAQNHGPATYNDYDNFTGDPGRNGGYTWTTYPERLEAAGISWQIYQNTADNFTDNPLAGFQSYRDAWFQRPGHSEALRTKATTTRDLDLLREDVMANRLPQVSWIVGTAEGSEHPGPSSPAQGADYTARVLDALTSNPDVWSKTVLIINFDENDGFFDHIPPPAPPSYLSWNDDPTQAILAGASTVDTTGEYHEHLLPYRNDSNQQALLHRPYGLGARVPMYVVSPWSKGGWVNSQVFDHTSIIRFLEARFGVNEPNISAWRRAVCGDLTTAFDFGLRRGQIPEMPDTTALAERARALTRRTLPVTPTEVDLPVQAAGVRPSRALPYELNVVSAVVGDSVTLDFVNSGAVGAVFHVYNRLDLGSVPRRYTVAAGRRLSGTWPVSTDGAYDLWVLAPNGWHRHVTGNARTMPLPQAQRDVALTYLVKQRSLALTLTNPSDGACTFVIRTVRGADTEPRPYSVGASGRLVVTISLAESPWYDLAITLDDDPTFGRRLAGRMEIGQDTHSDPAMHGVAVADQFQFHVEPTGR